MIAMLAQGNGHFKREEAEVVWIIPFAPGTEEGMEPDDLLCSRNAWSRTPLVGRAQWKINQPPSLRDYERDWRDHLYGRWSLDLCSGGRRTFLNHAGCEPQNNLAPR